MTVLRIGVSFTPSTGGSAYNFLIDNFGDDAIPRQYIGSYEFSLSTSGANVMSGPSFNDRYQWTISTKVTKAEAENFDAMYRAWDTDRSEGKAAALGVIDETFGATVNTSAIFITPPSFNRLSAKVFLLSFGMQEV